MWAPCLKPSFSACHVQPLPLPSLPPPPSPPPSHTHPTAPQTLEEEMVVPAAAAVSAAMGVLGRGGAPPAASAAAAAALDEAEEGLADAVLDGPEEVDEFGRSVNIGRRREADARRCAGGARALASACIQPMTCCAHTL